MTANFLSFLMNSPMNSTDGVTKTLPPEMQFTVVNIIVIAIYTNLFWISVLGNMVVFISLLKRKKKGRVHILLINLCIADMHTTCIEMPLRIAWKSTVQWEGNDLVCRIMAFLRVYGLYLSAFLLIAISVDRFLAIWDPLSSVRTTGRRTRAMVGMAWLCSTVCAAPQALIWHVMVHPRFLWYQQCVTFNSLSPAWELAYGISLMLLTYGLPLIVIFVCYMGIWIKILQSSLQHDYDASESDLRRGSTASSLRTSNCTRLLKAKKRTLRMTVFIVGIFALCWSPYQIMCLWYMFDRSSAVEVNQLGQEILFIFGVSSSVMNPYIYGLWSMGIWRELRVSRLIPCLKGRFKKAQSELYISRPGTDPDSDDMANGRHRASLPMRLSVVHSTYLSPPSQSRWAFGQMSRGSFSSCTCDISSRERSNSFA